ncbi:MAG TPA: MFS transporter [Candidatus Binatia bacterium]|nr:MFS transporter [Candidatus Binatia bacterium]
MLIGGIALGLLAGLLAGGRLDNLLRVRLRWIGLLFLAVLVRFGTELLIVRGIEWADALRLPLFASAYALLLVGLWVNRRHPGISLAFVGSLANMAAIVLNGGSMPIYEPSLRAAGLRPEDVSSPFYSLIGPELPGDFILRAGPLIDLIPLPVPPFQGVASIGDLFLGAGLAFFAFAAVLRGGKPELALETAGAPEGTVVGLAGVARPGRAVEAAVEGRPVRPATGLSSGLAEASALERPLVLAGSGPGLVSPALVSLPGPDEPGSEGVAPDGALTAVGVLVAPRETAAQRLLRRLRAHPYVRLALNGGFSALWAGQLISLFGDRIHQVALVFLVLGLTNSPAAVGLVFVAATLPNLLLGPVAGTFVDRWEHREVMIVADLLRAAVIVLVPLAAVTNILLVYPLVFLVTAISVFFRPARTAIIPRIVRRDELMAANSATWVGETIADIVGYPLAGIFVALLGAALPLAFWVDAGTYLVSAVLLAMIQVTPLARSASSDGRPGFVAELRAGWQFLRRETVLLANTLQGVVGQLTAGMLLTVAPLYARDAITGSDFEPTAIYGFLETGIGVGNLVGGFLLGLVGARLAKGTLVIIGYAAAGICTAALAFTGNLPTAIGLMVGVGVANMVYVIPSQTLFQERTPAELMGRVVGFRFALVFGAMTLAMGGAGVLVELVGLGPVLVVSGLMTFGAGVAGLLVPAVRRA